MGIWQCNRKQVSTQGALPQTENAKQCGPQICKANEQCGVVTLEAVNPTTGENSSENAKRCISRSAQTCGAKYPACPCGYSCSNVRFGFPLWESKIRKLCIFRQKCETKQVYSKCGGKMCPKGARCATVQIPAHVAKGGHAKKTRTAHQYCVGDLKSIPLCRRGLCPGELTCSTITFPSATRKTQTHKVCLSSKATRKAKIAQSKCGEWRCSRKARCAIVTLPHKRGNSNICAMKSTSVHRCVLPSKVKKCKTNEDCGRGQGCMKTAFQRQLADGEKHFYFCMRDRRKRRQNCRKRMPIRQTSLRSLIKVANDSPGSSTSTNNAVLKSTTSRQTIIQFPMEPKLVSVNVGEIPTYRLSNQLTISVLPVVRTSNAAYCRSSGARDVSCYAMCCESEYKVRYQVYHMTSSRPTNAKLDLTYILLLLSLQYTYFWYASAKITALAVAHEHCNASSDIFARLLISHTHRYLQPGCRA
jgi:hypothetical protein